MSRQGFVVVGCLLPQVMMSVVLTPGLPTDLPFGLELPEGLHRPAPPPGPTKTVLGTRLMHSSDTENFSLQWRDASISSAEVDQIGADMEAAWEGLVDSLGWIQPTTTEAHLLTVILDPTLTATGLTFAEPTEDYPAGVPIIYINPIYAPESAFMSALCAHEFGHALQFRSRDWYEADELEPWYWEATAEWQAELARPESNTYAWSSVHYAAAPHVDHHSMVDYHQYGMFLLNAYLEEYEIGTGGIRDLWENNGGLGWLDEISGSVGKSPHRIWAEFGGAVIAEALRESHLYTQPVTASGTTSLEGWLGHHYIELGPIDGAIYLEGGIGTVVRDGDWQVFQDEVAVPDGEGGVWLVVTNPDPAPLNYVITLGEAPPEDTGDPPVDTGSPGVDPDAQDGGRTSPQLGRLAIDTTTLGKGCACSGAGHGAGWWWTMVPIAATRRRRADHR